VFIYIFIYEQGINGVEQIINPKTLNEYNGSLLCDDGITSITNNAFRREVVAGYIPLTRQIFFQIEQYKSDLTSSEYVCKLFNIDTRTWASDRIIGNTANGRGVSFVGKRNDKLVNLSVLDIGVLKYPVIGRFEDEIASTGTSANTGFPTTFTINIGELYSFNPIMRIWDMSIHFNANIVSGNPTMTLELLANDETVAFDTHVISLADGQPRTLRVAERGAVYRLRFRATIAASTNHLLRNVFLSTIRLGFVPEQRKGG